LPEEQAGEKSACLVLEEKAGMRASPSQKLIGARRSIGANLSLILAPRFELNRNLVQFGAISPGPPFKPRRAADNGFDPRPTAAKETPPRILRRARIRNDAFSIREIREIRGEEFSW
jgi:hypothetical protein